MEQAMSGAVSVQITQTRGRERHFTFFECPYLEKIFVSWMEGSITHCCMESNDFTSSQVLAKSKSKAIYST